MTKILNTTIEEASKNLSNGHIQRLSIDVSKGTNFEILITPLGSNWKTNRLTGAGAGYFAVSIVGYGCYPFKLHKHIGAGYFATKLDIPFSEAEDITNLFNKFKIEFYDSNE